MARNQTKTPLAESPASSLAWPRVFVITCTGARPEAFSLCEKYMRRQTLKRFTWIVVDDYYEATKCTMGQDVVRPEPFWPNNSVHNTLNRNMVAGLRAAFLKGCSDEDTVVFVEDDDWYSPAYLANQDNALRGGNALMVGQAPACYYHVKLGVYKVFDNRTHASLCQTAIKGSLVQRLIEHCESGDWIDVNFWGKAASVGRIYLGHDVVGIKGLPGRPGVSAVHRTLGGGGWVGDPDGDKLREWIGAEDAAAYRHHRLAHSNWEIHQEPPAGATEDLSKGKLETFVGLGNQLRYRCPGVPGQPCSHDSYDPVQVMRHWQATHAPKDAGPSAGVVLFDANDKPVQPTRRIIVPGVSE